MASLVGKKVWVVQFRAFDYPQPDIRAAALWARKEHVWTENDRWISHGIVSIDGRMHYIAPAPESLLTHG